jgi:hypothetical protein
MKTLAVLGGIILGVVIAAALILFAPFATADESSYIAFVNSKGLPVGPVMLAVGHQVCTDASANGVAGLDNEALLGLNANLTPREIAVVIVGAVHELCPSNLPALQAWMVQHNDSPAT